MEHLAIMKKSLGYLEKIISSNKTVESRWYFSKRAPWDKIKKEDLVYFKNSGNAVTVRTKVDKVIQFDNLTPQKINEILIKYGRRIGIDNSKDFFKEIKTKQYCILIFLKGVKEITPFFIDKTGYGIMSAWISVDDINKIKR